MISVCIPVLNEAENIKSLIAEIKAAAEKAPIAEIVIVDDDSEDNTIDVIKSLKPHTPAIKLIAHDKRGGQSAALRTAIRAATNPIIVTMDGDGQNDPADIPALYQKFTEADPALKMLMIAGQRKKRIDSSLKKFASRMANAIRGFLLNDGIRDTGCSLKLCRRDDYLTLPYFDHMHRYLPALFLREYGTILTIDVAHRARLAGTSKYGFWDRALVGIYDLIGVIWLIKRKSNNITAKEL